MKKVMNLLKIDLVSIKVIIVNLLIIYQPSIINNSNNLNNLYQRHQYNHNLVQEKRNNIN